MGTAVELTRSELNRVEAYHRDYARNSHSSLKLFDDSRELYAAIRIHRTRRPKPPTPEMIFGNVFDCLLLTPYEMDDRYIVAPECDRRTKAGKAQWAEFQETSGGKTLIEEGDLLLAMAMREAVQHNEWACAAIEAEGDVQRVIEWDDKETGRPLKMMSDKILRSGLILDVKTCASVAPSFLARQVANLGYHRQAALYLDGAWQAAHVDGPFVFLFVGKETPHEVVCCTLDDDALRIGREQNKRTIRELDECYKSGDWRGRWSRDIQTLSLPKWASF